MSPCSVDHREGSSRAKHSTISVRFDILDLWIVTQDEANWNHKCRLVLFDTGVDVQTVAAHTGLLVSLSLWDEPKSPGRKRDRRLRAGGGQCHVSCPSSSRALERTKRGGRDGPLSNVCDRNVTLEKRGK